MVMKLGNSPGLKISGSLFKKPSKYSQVCTKKLSQCGKVELKVCFIEMAWWPHAEDFVQNWKASLFLLEGLVIRFKEDFRYSKKD